LGPLATGAGESVRTDHDSSVTASPNALRNQSLVQSHHVRASRCVYTRAVDVAMAAIFELYNGVSSTHNVESLYPPNVWNHKLVCMHWRNTKSRGEGLFMNMNKFSYISNSSFPSLHFRLGSTWSGYRFLYFGRGEAWRLGVPEVPPRIVLIVLRFLHSFYHPNFIFFCGNICLWTILNFIWSLTPHSFEKKHAWFWHLEIKLLYKFVHEHFLFHFGVCWLGLAP
jgi:hypothetical protein